MLPISNTISQVQSKLALAPFLTAGYPDIKATKKIIYLLDKQGANLIEVGIPYSDALADGPVIQDSSRVALEKNIYVEQVLSLLNEVTPKIVAPVIVFTYFNPVLSRGLHIFIKEIAASGAKGLIIPDLPLEEATYLIAICDYYSIELIFFISPATSEERMRFIVSNAPGCLYLVSDYGVTGARKTIAKNIKSLVQSIKSKTNKYILLGFGISSVEQITSLVESRIPINAIVVGSALINQITRACSLNAYTELSLFCESIKKAMS